MRSISVRTVPRGRFFAYFAGLGYVKPALGTPCCCGLNLTSRPFQAMQEPQRFVYFKFRGVSVEHVIRDLPFGQTFFPLTIYLV